MFFKLIVLRKVFKMKNKLVLCFAVLFLFGIASFSCYAQSSNNDQRIVGTWVTENGQTIVFNADGSGSVTNYIYSSANFIYGISLSGSLGCTISELNNQQIYFSPDGRTLIIRGNAFRKR